MCHVISSPVTAWSSRRPQDAFKGHLAPSLVKVPGEIKRREVELDPQVSPEEIMSREVELGCES